MALQRQGALVTHFALVPLPLLTCFHSWKYTTLSRHTVYTLIYCRAVMLLYNVTVMLLQYSQLLHLNYSPLTTPNQDCVVTMATLVRPSQHCGVCWHCVYVKWLLAPISTSHQEGFPNIKFSWKSEYLVKCRICKKIVMTDSCVVYDNINDVERNLRSELNTDADITSIIQTWTVLKLQDIFMYSATQYLLTINSVK